MNKTQLIDTISAQVGFSRDVAAKLVNGTFDAIQTALASGDEVVITGFGTFKPVDKAAKSRFNALAGRVVDTPAKTIPTFKAGAVLKAAVDAGQQGRRAA